MGGKRQAAPKITPGIIGASRYELVKAPDYAGSRAWARAGRRQASRPGPPHLAGRAEPPQLGGGRQRRNGRGQPSPHAATEPGKRTQKETAAMPSMNLDTADAAERLQYLTGWLASDPARLAA